MKTAHDPKPALIPGMQMVRHLGSGGFADVFLYEQKIPHRQVAVKIQRSGLSVSLDRAFRNEVDMLARLSSHPGIVSLYDAGATPDGRQYMAMEYCPHPSVATQLKTGSFSVAEVLDIGIRIAGALSFAHTKGVLHHDVKPANILFTEFGHPVLTDFGLAAPTGGEAERAVKGFSAPWAPPEQHQRSVPYTESGDQYALAATLYTMLEQRSPFEIPGADNSDLAIISRVLSAPLPPIERADVPPMMVDVLATALHKRADDRFASMQHFANALQQIQSQLDLSITALELRPEAVRPQFISNIVDGSVKTRNELTHFVTGEPSNRSEDRFVDETKLVDAVLHSKSCQCEECRKKSRWFSPELRQMLVKNRFLIAMVATVAAVSLGAWIYSANKASEDTENSSVPQDQVALSVHNPIEDLRGELGADGLTFSWSGVGTDAVYLYRFLDTLDTQEVQQTRENSVTVLSPQGRVCVEVIARFADGTTTPPTQACVDSPGTP